MKKVIYSIIISSCVFFAFEARAQFAAQNDARHMATLRAVVEYKINDEEIANDVESLRENQWFLRDLQRRLDRLQNTRSKNAVNRRVYNILIQAGRDIDRALQ